VASHGGAGPSARRRDCSGGARLPAAERVPGVGTWQPAVHHLGVACSSAGGGGLVRTKKMARLEGSVRPVPKTGQTGLVKLLKKQNGLHHYIALDDQNVYVEHPIWTSNERDMGSGSSAPRADRLDRFIGAVRSV